MGMVIHGFVIHRSNNEGQLYVPYQEQNNVPKTFCYYLLELALK
jgi:hypothetical protein